MGDERFNPNYAIGVDLVTGARSYRDFLNSLTANEQFVNDRVLKKAVYRYEYYWLPLLAECSYGDLVPPPDVHWVWHLHMLLPDQYRRYCTDRFGQTLAHSIRTSTTGLKYSQDVSQGNWKEKYPFEPYTLDVHDFHAQNFTYSATSSRIPELYYLAIQTKQFLYQISIPQYRDKVFLSAASERYKKVLYLKKFRPEVKFQLPVDIELMWRVHILHPLAYTQDINNLIKHTIVPLADLSDNARYMSLWADSSAKEVWKSMFREPLLLPGTGYRGDAQAKQIAKITEGIFKVNLNETCDISFDDVCVSDLWSQDSRLVVEGRCLGETLVMYQTMFRVAGKPGHCISSSNPNLGLGRTKFDSKRNRGIEFHVYGQKGRSCFRKEQHVTTVFFSPTKQFSGQRANNMMASITIPKVTYTDPTFSFTCRLRVEESSPHVLTLTRQPFDMGDIPEHLSLFLKSQPSWTYALRLRDRMPFAIAEHILTLRGTHSTFKCCVVKSDDFDLAAISLHSPTNQLVAVAHTIGVEQLPTLEQVSQACPFHIDLEGGEQAMIIRNHIGDWSVCVASWESHIGSREGRAHIRLYNLQHRRESDFYIEDDEFHVIKFGDLSIDLPTGRITIDAACLEPVEYLTLAFCIGSLFVTCQKRAITAPASVGSVKSFKSGASLESTGASSLTVTKRMRFKAKMRLTEKKLTSKRRKSASFTFLLASGLQMDLYLSGGGARYSTAMPRKSIIDAMVPAVDSNSNITSNKVASTEEQTTHMEFGPDDDEEPACIDIRL